MKKPQPFWLGFFCLHCSVKISSDIIIKALAGIMASGVLGSVTWAIVSIMTLQNKGAQDDIKFGSIDTQLVDVWDNHDLIIGHIAKLQLADKDNELRIKDNTILYYKSQSQFWENQSKYHRDN